MFTVLIHILFGGLMIGAVVMLLAPFYWIFDLFVQFVPQFCIAAAAVLVLLVIKRKWAQAFMLMAALLYFSWSLATLWVPATARVAPTLDQKTLKILHANVKFTNQESQALINVITREQPQIISLNEATIATAEKIRRAFDETYPYRFQHESPDYRGMLVLSQIPIVESEKIIFSHETSPSLRLTFADPALTLFAVHALSPITESWAAQRDGFIRDITWRANEVSGNLIVVGDLNISPHDAIFSGLLREGRLEDGRRGYGWNPTWLADTPLAIAIDHFLYRGTMTIQDFRVLEDIGSDHRPIVVTVRFGDNKE